MTVVLPLSRSLAQQLLARSARSVARPVSTNPLLRVDCNCSPDNDQFSHPSTSRKFASLFHHARTYATAVGRPASRPKQHTGRTPAKRTTTTTKKAAPAKTSVAKTAKKPVTRKPAAKKPKKRIVKKATPKVKKEPSKAALLRKARKDKADARSLALLEEPKQLPSTAFQVLLVEEIKGKKRSVTTGATAVSSKYKNLTLEEREHYNHEANQNKSQNEVAYKKWVLTHAPLRIKQANIARRQLTRKAKAAGQKKQFRPIRDDRIVLASRNSYSYFFQERNLSGDLAGMTVGERGKLVAQEWKNLSATEKKPFDDQAKVDKSRYIEEYKTVYGVDAPLTKTKATKAS